MDLEALDDVELRCYYYCLGAFPSAVLRRMLNETMIKLSRPGGADRETLETAVPQLACISTYLRERRP